MPIQDLYNVTDTVALTHVAEERYQGSLLENVAVGRSENLTNEKFEIHKEEWLRKIANYKVQGAEADNVTPNPFDVRTEKASYLACLLYTSDAADE